MSTAEQQELIADWQGLPRSVKNRVNKYRDACQEKAEGLSAWKGAKQALIDDMRKNNLSRIVVEIDGVKKEICVEDEPKLTSKAYKDPTPIAGDDD